MDRHLTVSGFVVHEGRVALHWHRKIGAWLPAGGHIEPGEDPVEATLREVREEFDVEARIIPTATRGPIGLLQQIEPPFAIQVCPVEPGHEHVDMVYFLECLSGFPGRSYDADNPIVWLDAAQIARGSLARNGVEVDFLPDVRDLGLEALRVAATIAVPATSASTPA
jgi:8-oxo-dGTP pyrophosphatase MutT (NUDIX family)